MTLVCHQEVSKERSITADIQLSGKKVMFLDFRHHKIKATELSAGTHNTLCARLRNVWKHFKAKIQSYKF